MGEKSFEAIGIVDISFYTNAIIVLDEMMKHFEVNLIRMEKKLGGRLISIIVGGEVSAVQGAIQCANGMKEIVGQKSIKIAIAIPAPHLEIVKLIYKEEVK